MQIKKRCGKINCRHFVEDVSQAYCDEHKGYTNKEYNDYRQKYEKEYVSFYKSTAWRKRRKVALRRDEYICIDCKNEGIISIAEEVHHIIGTKDDWSKRLELDNLICLCRMHHDKRHNR